VARACAMHGGLRRDIASIRVVKGAVRKRGA
jgi:hypothetical protein